ncbi:MAG: SPASM domain-containing protein [Candidatus Eisenbacteria sp.]|nr:SPASM domain-containing protein [Candidatus Eisenbacteria bacterium]
MVFKKRLLHLILRRATHLPKGKRALDYTLNRMRYQLALRQRKVVLPHPISLMIELTNLCQLKCITCAREYALGQAMDTGNMDLAQAKKLIDESHVFLDRIGLTGLGEPLLYPHLVEILDYIEKQNRGICIFISTNAQVPNTLKIMEAIGDKIDTLQVSVDGIGEVFESIRSKSDFASSAKNLEAIVKLSKDMRFDVKLNMVVFSRNYHQLTDIVAFAKQMGLSEIFLNSINLVSNDWDLSEYRVYETPEFQRELNKALSLARKEGIYVEYPKFTTSKGFKHCPYPWNSFYITWDGFLVPCCAKPFPKELDFGNVFEGGLLNCINSQKLREFRRMSISNTAPEFCRRCHYVE